MSPFKGKCTVYFEFLLSVHRSFKVIRCRYYADDGKAISPYCSAGRRCTFLHPGDKGWPGGDPSLEIGKRPEERERVVSERPHPRALKGPVNSSSYSTGHHKVFMPRTSINATTTATDIISETSHSPIRKTDLHTSTGQLPVLSIVQTFHLYNQLSLVMLHTLTWRKLLMQRFQSKITQDKEELTRAVEKLAAYRELLESLSTISVTSATAVRHTLDVITKARDHLEVKLQEDTKQLSGLWDEVFSVFLRAICRQFDNELEAGTDFLRHEARMLMKSFPKHFGIQSLTPNIQENRSHLHHRSQVSGGPDNYGVTNTIVDGKKSASKFEDEEFAVNPPIGSSDNGWGHKRRRISSSSTEEDTNADGSAWLNLKEVIVKMQRQLDNQDDKIKVLTSQNLAVS
ncbi:hypothetical protein K439DRAFT_1618095 [Ramaria rubella]|nr:hypothetical protein K439DRAFT_1618095 [Ramaria rubella]